MPAIKQNPDRRPLPVGWRQHYDPERDVWYYIDLDTSPPFASYVHPADTLACLATLSSSSSSGSGSSSSVVARSRSGSLALASTSASNSTTTSPSLSSTTPQLPSGLCVPVDIPILEDDGMTYAQRLYASSMRNITGGRSSIDGLRPTPSPRGSIDQVRESNTNTVSPTPGSSTTAAAVTNKASLPLQDSPPSHFTLDGDLASNPSRVANRTRRPASRKGSAVQGSVVTSLTPAALALHNRATSPLAGRSTTPKITPAGGDRNIGGVDGETGTDAGGDDSSTIKPAASLYNPSVVSPPASGATISSTTSRTFPIPIGPRAPLNRRASYASAKSIDMTKPSTPSPQFQTNTNSAGAASQLIGNRRALPSLPLGTASSDSSVMIIPPFNNTLTSTSSAPSTRGAFNGVSGATTNTSRQKTASIPLSYPAITEDNILFAPPQTQAQSASASLTSSTRRRGDHQRVGSLPITPNLGLPVISSSPSPIFLPHPQDDSADALTSVQPIAATAQAHSQSHSHPQPHHHHHSSLSLTRQTRSHTVSELPRHYVPSPSAASADVTAPSSSDHMLILQPKPIRPLKGMNQTLQDQLTTTPSAGSGTMTLEPSPQPDSAVTSGSKPSSTSTNSKWNTDQSPSGGPKTSTTASSSTKNTSKTPFLQKLGVIIGARP